MATTGNTRRRPTISDIAKAAHVSKTTVSRFINGRTDELSPDLAARVEATIRELDYHPSAVARSLRSHRSYTVGVLVANIATPFGTSIVSGVSERLREAGYTAIVVAADDSPQRQGELADTLLRHQVDGLIVNSATDKDHDLVRLGDRGVPAVLVDRAVEGADFDIALSTYDASVRALVEHLAEQGFARAALFTEPFVEVRPRRDRHEAFCAVDREAFGSPDPEADVFVVNPWEHETVDAALDELLATTDGPPAIVATNTLTLIGAFNAIQRRGLSMPQDVGLCGPDDWGWAHRMGWDWPESLGPGVTTMVTRPYSMGFAAADLMVTRLAQPERAHETRDIPTDVVFRASTLLRRPQAS